MSEKEKAVKKKVSIVDVAKALEPGSHFILVDDDLKRTLVKELPFQDIVMISEVSKTSKWNRLVSKKLSKEEIKARLGVNGIGILIGEDGFEVVK